MGIKWTFNATFYFKLVLEYKSFIKMSLDLMVLHKIKDETYAINLDGYFNIGTHWIALYALNNNVTFFNSFGI